MIRISNLSKSYRTESGDFKALEDINLDIYDGDIFGIIGMSGAGKSTLLRCINLLERPTKGQIFIDDIEMTTLKKKDLLAQRKKIGVIFQNFNLLFQKNVYDNIAFGLELLKTDKDEIRNRVQKLLGIVGLEDKVDSYPAQLSGGQKQRVAIARALATNPDVLLCDEATSALDSMTTASILALLQEINRTLGVTIILITHEIQVIHQICNRMAVIDNTKIIEVGKTKEILSAPQMDVTKQLIGGGLIWNT